VSNEHALKSLAAKLASALGVQTRLQVVSLVCPVCLHLKQHS